MAAKTYEFKVAMTCEGCSGAVERILNRMKDKGVESFEIDLKAEKVLVTTTLSAEEVLEALKKSGKKTELVGEVKA